MAAKLSQKDYLKKYLSGGDDKKKKKKKKPKGTFPVSQAKVKVIDDDVDLSKLQPLDESALDLYEVSEDAPQIAGIVDERPAELQAQDQYKLSQRWKVLSNPDGDGISVSDASKPSQAKFANLDHNDEDEEEFNVRPTSQHVRSVKKGGESPRRPKRYDSDASPPRKGHQSDSDASPPRKGKHYDSDASPPRKGKQYDSDASPPRKKRHDSDTSPPRKRRQIDSDTSPPRKRQQHDSDTSPPRKRRQNDSKVSPRRKRKGSDSDTSPPRKRRDSSPPRRRQQTDPDPSSPKRRHQNSSLEPLRRKTVEEHSRSSSQWQKSQTSRSDAQGISTLRNSHDFDPAKKIKMETEDGSSSKTDKKMKKTLDGKVAGLQDAKKLVQEMLDVRERENEAFERMDDSISGRGATVVQRDRKTGLKRDLEQEQAEQRARDEKDNKKKEKYSRWGKGLKQTEDQQERFANDLYEMSKPLARYADDADLDSYLRNQEREGDPMAGYLKSKKKEEAKSSVPLYKGPFPPNRYNIRPGYRWDGVDRSNGYEKKRFESLNAKKATEEDAYKWSTSDM